MPEPVVLRVTLNGEARELRCLPGERLLDLLRGLGLTGVKEGCGEGECGACAVLLDGRLVNSCLVPALQVDGATLLTIEGAATDRELAAVQAAFAERGGVQCGICTPGMVLAAGALLKRSARPVEEEIRRALAGNLCRCTGYVRVVDSVLAAAERLGPPDPPAQG
ncbi:MAG: (2Fe-2S)-binding protein [Candidatus Delongbacteria bacterium]